jgi:betaine-aldehyde dehydrogenase
MTATVSTSVAGSWIDGAPVITGGGLHQVINPASDRGCGRHALASSADVERAVASARAALPGWATVTRPTARGAGCRLRWPVSMPTTRWPGGRSDRQPVRLAAEFDAGQRRQHRLPPQARPATRGQATAGDHPRPHVGIRRAAIGVVGTITPWNYPLQMAVWKVLPALAAGCTVVIKPRTDNVDADAARLAKIGLPNGANVVTGAGSDVGTALAGHPDVDLVTFTGSTAVAGWLPPRCTAPQLELGGKAPRR